MKIGDIVFVRGKGIVGSIVKYATKSKYSHVALAVSEKHVVEIDWKYDVRIRELEHLNYDIYSLNRDLTIEEEISIINFVYSLLGRKYDFLKIVSLILELTFKARGKLLFNNKNKLICSDIIDLAFQNIGVDLVPDHKEQDVTPQELCLSRDLIFIESVDLN